MDPLSSIRERHAAAECTAKHCRLLRVDLPAHRQAVEMLAQSLHMSRAAVVRTALAEWLASRAAAGDLPEAAVCAEAPAVPLHDDRRVWVRFQLSATSALRLAQAARAAEISRSLLVNRLVEGLPPTQAWEELKESRLALLISTDMLAALCNDLLALERSMNQASCADCLACKAMIDPLPAALSRHLALASALMRSLIPWRRSRRRESGAS